jgi:hypothetical protein
MARDSIISGITQKDPKMMTSEDTTIPLNDIAQTTIPQRDDAKEHTNEDLLVNTITEIANEEENKTLFPEKPLEWNPEHECIKAVQAAIINMRITPKLKWRDSIKGYKIRGQLKEKWGYRKPAKNPRSKAKHNPEPRIKQEPTSK